MANNSGFLEQEAYRKQPEDVGQSIPTEAFGASFMFQLFIPALYSSI
jgi:hypothetical protein